MPNYAAYDIRALFREQDTLRDQLRRIDNRFMNKGQQISQDRSAYDYARNRLNAVEREIASRRLNGTFA